MGWCFGLGTPPTPVPDVSVPVCCAAMGLGWLAVPPASPCAPVLRAVLDGGRGCDGGCGFDGRCGALVAAGGWGVWMCLWACCIVGRWLAAPPSHPPTQPSLPQPPGKNSTNECFDPHFSLPLVQSPSSHMYTDCSSEPADLALLATRDT